MRFALELRELLVTYIKRNKMRFLNQEYNILIKFCCFNQQDKTKIVAGLKNKITLDMAMNGRELCELINVSYDDITQQRMEHQRQNFEFFMKNIMEIPEINDFIRQAISTP